MASVRWWKFVTDNLAAKILALVMAASFWFTITIEKETVKSFIVPVRMINIPPGLTIGGSLPRDIEVTVAGPAVLFLAHPVPWKPVTLDLRKTAKGTVGFPDLGRFVQVPNGVSVIRVFPSRLDLELVER
jgi:hypothetical protein